jgi:hypothetical protein
MTSESTRAEPGSGTAGGSVATLAVAAWISC